MAGVETVAAGFAFVLDFAAEERGEESGVFVIGVVRVMAVITTICGVRSVGVRHGVKLFDQIYSVVPMG